MLAGADWGFATPMFGPIYAEAATAAKNPGRFGEPRLRLRGSPAATFETHPIPPHTDRAAGTEIEPLQMVFTANYDGYEVPGESALN